MIHQSQTAGHKEKVSADDPRYKPMVAEPVMQAVDSMPAAYRRLVHEHGYVDVYRAWRKGWSVEQIMARAGNGLFIL